MTNDRQHGWIAKFGNAVRGIGQGVRGQSSFAVHLTVAVMVIVAALLIDVPFTQFMVLLLCIGMVLVAEMFNSSLEHLARAVTREHDEQVKRSLDIASGTVLVACLIAIVIGALIFGQAIFQLTNVIRGPVG